MLHSNGNRLSTFMTNVYEILPFTSLAGMLAAAGREGLRRVPQPARGVLEHW
jgi:hypothetical protein